MSLVPHQVAAIRRFNRFYTRQLGLLDEHLPASRLTLAEARVVYELATGGEQSAAELCRQLSMDKAHLSRITARFRVRGLLERRPNPRHGRQQLLSLTDRGRAAFAAVDQGTRHQLETLLAPLEAKDRQALIDAMGRIEKLLGGDARPAPAQLRPVGIGDVGWVIHRQALLYHRDYGWDRTYEALAAEILAGFLRGFDPARDDGWVAEQGGEIVGSVFLTSGPDPDCGRLRLLYVEPAARGHGVGRLLVQRCVARARQLGYRRLSLWTNSVLTAARQLYQETGFQLVEEAPHSSFGQDLLGQTWVLRLAE